MRGVPLRMRSRHFGEDDRRGSSTRPGSRPRRTRSPARIFRRLAEAEAVVHHRDVEHVTFHEVGAVDSIVDIAGTALALTLLGIERIFASPVPTGLGMVRTQHGMMPIPAPAVVELLRGAPIFSRGVPMELVTPTGAAILAATVEGFGDLPMMRPDAVGYGAGSTRADFPNVLRVIVGEEDTAHRAAPAVPATAARHRRRSCWRRTSTTSRRRWPRTRWSGCWPPARRTPGSRRYEEGPSRPSRSPRCAPPIARRSSARSCSARRGRWASGPRGSTARARPRGVTVATRYGRSA